MRNPPVPLRAHPPNDNHILRAFERAVFAAMLDNARGVGRADAGQLHQLFDGSGVDVDALVGRLLRGEGKRQLREAECEKQGQWNDAKAKEFHQKHLAKPRDALRQRKTTADEMKNIINCRAINTSVYSKSA
jgi:hypothetical protein